MKKSQLGMILFWVVVIGLKVWSGFHGQTSPADLATEITGFLFMLTGSICFVLFQKMFNLRIKAQGAAAIQNLAHQNYLALLFQGLLLAAAGTLMIFLKWWAAVAVGGLFMVGIVILFCYGWPHTRISEKYFKNPPPGSRNSELKTGQSGKFK